MIIDSLVAVVAFALVVFKLDNFVVGVNSFCFSSVSYNKKMGYSTYSIIDERCTLSNSIPPPSSSSSLYLKNKPSSAQQQQQQQQQQQRRRRPVGRVVMIGDMLLNQQDQKQQLYCSAINDGEDLMSLSSASSDDSIIDNNTESSSTIRTWKEKLLAASNFASLLCVVDCTLLPAITFVLPLLGLLTLSPSQMTFLHELGHKVALYFVMPVGVTATCTNYFMNHKKLKIATVGWIGLLLIYLANSGTGGACSAAGHTAHEIAKVAVEHAHHHVHHHVHSHVHAHAHHHGTNLVVQFISSTFTWINPALGQVITKLIHTIQHGIAHRIANLTGCFLLILSNYISRKVTPAHVHGPNCSHNSNTKGHVHGPNCRHSK